ncbi:MAG: PspA/IM30 family protein [Fimbriimonadaceae bacterium]
MLKRFFRWIKAVFHRGMDNLEDPEIMLDQARRDMQEAIIGNREKAVQAITQKNRLQNLYDSSVQKSAKLEQQATLALQQGNRDLARQFIREKASNDATMEQLKPSLAAATAAVESVKLALKRQEEEVRKKTAEALALKAQWKQAQIQNSISKALEGLTFENQIEGFGAAEERIREAQSEAAARTEMLGTSLQGQVMQMEDQAMDYAAEAELQKLEQRLGMGASTATTTEATQTVSVSAGDGTVAPTAPEPLASEVDRELDELEKRLGG